MREVAIGWRCRFVEILCLCSVSGGESVLVVYKKSATFPHDSPSIKIQDVNENVFLKNPSGLGQKPKDTSEMRSGRDQVRDTER